MLVKGDEIELRSVDHARSLGIDCVYQDLALVNELDVVQNMFLRRELVKRPLPFLARAQMRKETRAALDEIGVNVPRLNVPVARLSAAVSARRSRSPARCTPTPTSSCSTSRWRRWAPRRAR